MVFVCRYFPDCSAWYEDFEQLVGHWERAHKKPALAWDVRWEIVLK